jgi:hypothetical protein
MFSSAISMVNSISLLTIIVTLFNGHLIAQQLDNSILKNTSWLEKPEVKKWEKQLSELEKAEKLLKESNDKYLEIGNKENDDNLDEEKKVKAVQKLEEEALNGSLKSLEKYKTIYLELNDIIDLKLKNEHFSHPAYKTMSNYLNQADSEYKKASEVEGFSRTEKLTSANEFQLRAIENGINIFTSPSVSYNEYQSGVPENTVPEDDIVIDAALLKMYQDYKDNGTVQDPLTAYKLMNLQEDQVTYSSFEEIWYRYQNDDFEKLQHNNASTGAVMTDSVESNKTDILAENNPNKQENLREKIPQYSNISTNQTITDSNNEKYVKDADANKEIAGISEQKDISSSEINEQAGSVSVKSYTTQGSMKAESGNYEFRIQIAASQTPLSINLIEAIYQNNLPVVEIKEGKYFKYQIKGFKSLTQAQRACSGTGVENAYIEAYKSMQRVQLSEAAAESLNDNKSGKSSRMEFAVQFAASKVRISDKRMSEIYNYPQDYRIVFENGWYKYQVYAGENLENAFGILEGLKKDKAFIVAYKNGEKLKLHNAIQEYKRNLP